MAFSKREHLRQNIEALRIAFTLERDKRLATEIEKHQLMQYSGFGGLKFVLNPYEDPIDINHWRKTEHDLFPIIQELHKLLRENTVNEKHYRRYVECMRNSVLTAFYTPLAVIKAISDALLEKELQIKSLLEPSAGVGSFIYSFKETDRNIQEITAYKKDLLTGKCSNIYILNIASVYLDLKRYLKKKREATMWLPAMFHLILRYLTFPILGGKVLQEHKLSSVFITIFFKGTDMLREGGVLAFITSQGVAQMPPFSMSFTEL